MTTYSIFIVQAIFPPNRAGNENKLNMFSAPPPLPPPTPSAKKKKNPRESNNPLAGNRKRVFVGEYETSPYCKF